MKRPAFDSLTLRAVVLELARDLAGGQVQRVRQPDDLTVVLQVHRYPHTRHLLISAHPEHFRAHLVSERPASSQEPPAFCMALRKHLEGGWGREVRQDGADRVMRVVVGTGLGDFTLGAELMGRHSNIVLLAPDGTVLEAIKHVGAKMSHRVVLPGRPYPPLPASGKPSLWDASFLGLHRAWNSLQHPVTERDLLGAFGGMSPYLAQRILNAESPEVEFTGLLEAVRDAAFTPHVYRDEAGVPTAAWPFPPPGASGGTCTMSEALDLVYASRTVSARRDRLKRELAALLDREQESVDRRRADLRRAAERAEAAEEWRIMGELLSASAHTVEKGAESVSLTNYYDPEMRPLVVPLDPTLSARENAEEYFTRQRKARAAAERIPAQAAELNRREAGLRARREQVEQADEEEMERLLAEWRGPEAQAPKGKRQEPEYPPGVRIRRYTSDEGFTILVGENATGNDYLTTRLSDPDDIWLHVRAAASAHAVIRTARKPGSVPPATLRRAAELVAARSEATGSSAIPVDYTLRRYVRKPRGAAPGRVTYEREKTLTVGPTGAD